MRGVGLDLLEIGRFEALVNKEYFMSRVFSDYERGYIFRRGKNAAATAAGLFCAKEAYIKAAGFKGYALRQIETRHMPDGRPVLYLNGGPAENAHVSITHTKLTAAAAVILD